MNFKALLKNTNTTVVAIIALVVGLVHSFLPELIPAGAYISINTILVTALGVLSKDGDKTSKGLGLE